MRKSATRKAVVIGGTLAGVSSTFAFGAQAALFPSDSGTSALDALSVNPSQSAPINSGANTPTPTASEKAKKAETKKKQDSPTPAPTKSVKKKDKNQQNNNQTSPSASETTPSQSGPADGVYTGTSAAARSYGNVQVQITVSGGQLTDIQFLAYPDRDGESRDISNRALPQLRQEALTAQSASVANISGASWTTRAFKNSLNVALAKAGL